MKKYIPILFVFALFITLLSFNTKPVSASNCASGDLFNAATGQPCANTSTTSIVSLPTGFNQQLSVGSKGEDVKAIQQILKDAGFLLGKVDGSYGPITKNAVMKYQIANSISSTGVVGSDTLVKIKLILWYKMCPLINSTYGVYYPCPSSLTTPPVSILPINGVCGLANGQTLTSVSTTNLCSTGTASSPIGNGPWYWGCTGLNGGSTVACSANIQTVAVNGVCGTTMNSCTTGTLNDITDSSTNYLWNCVGANSGTIASCSANKQAVPVNGVCGTTQNACTAGTLNDIADSSTNYLWNCAGANGGTIASCSANKQAVPVNGVCGTTNNVCTTGTLNDITDSSTNYLWNCAGANGGTQASCSANKQAGVGSPDLTVTAFSGVGSAYDTNTVYNMSVTIKNQGDASTASANQCGQIAVKVYLSSNASTSGTPIGTLNVGDLGVGQSVSNSIVATADTSCSVHNYCVFVVKVDADNCVTESNEDNNIRAKVSYRGR